MPPLFFALIFGLYAKTKADVLNFIEIIMKDYKNRTAILKILGPSSSSNEEIQERSSF